MSKSGAVGRLFAAADEILPEALELSHRVHANPEIAFQEHQAARWTADLLRAHGFDVEAPAGGLETAFVARWRGERPGPVVAFAGEYDALPEVGHGCGHNLMCSSSAGAAIAAANVLGRDFGGEVRFIGTPAEEAGNGKVHLINAGIFDDVDVCLQIHPSDSNASESVCLAVTEIGVTFHGKLAHASGDPWLGKNALDAIVLLHTMVAQWRQHLKPGRACPRDHHARRGGAERRPGSDRRRLVRPHAHRPGSRRLWWTASARWPMRRRWRPAAASSWTWIPPIDVAPC